MCTLILLNAREEEEEQGRKTGSILNHACDAIYIWEYHILYTYKYYILGCLRIIEAKYVIRELYVLMYASFIIAFNFFLLTFFRALCYVITARWGNKSTSGGERWW